MESSAGFVGDVLGPRVVRCLLEDREQRLRRGLLLTHGAKRGDVHPDCEMGKDVLLGRLESFSLDLLAGRVRAETAKGSIREIVIQRHNRKISLDRRP